MIGITCTDTYGDTVSFLTQWDVNISLTITCYDKITTPVFHFSNQSRTEALVVDEVTTSGNASAGYELTAKIPNVLLQEPYPIMMYLYDYLGNTGESGVPAKVRASARIPMRRRTKPSPYKYAETIDGAYFSEITALIQKKLDALDDGSIVYPDLTDLKSDCEDMQNAITKCQTSLRNEAAVDLDFDESTGEITLRNSVGAQTGDAVKIPTTLGISGISADTVQTDSDYYLVLYDEDGNELTRTLLPSSNSGIDSTTIDDSLSSTSEQPVQNKVINSAIEAINTNVGTMSDLQVSADNLVAAINKIDDKAKAAAATTYASTSEAGIVKLYSVDGKNTSGLNVDAADGSVWIGTNSDKGTQKTSSGEIATAAADVTDIDAAINSYKPIVPSTLSYAVQSIGGTLTELKTQSQDSYISAINEIKTDIDDIVASGIGTVSTMTTAMYENVGTSESMLTLPHKISEILEFILAKVNGLQSHIYEFPTTNLTLNYPEIVTGDVSSEAKAPGVIASIPMPCGVYHINIPANSTYFYIRSFTIRDKDDSSTSYTVKYTDKSGEGRFLTGHNYWAYFGDQGSKLLYSDVFGQQPIPCNYSITDGQLSSSIAAKPGIFLCDEADGQYTITYPVLSMYNDESGETTQIKFDLNGNIYTRCDSTGIGGESWTEWAKVVPDVDSALSFTSSNPVQNKVINTAINNAVANSDNWDKGYEWCNTFSNNFSNSSYLSVDEIASDMGNVASLETTATNLVGAINEIKNAQTTGGVTVDEALSSTSTNPVQNKTVYTALNSGYYGVATMSVGTDTVTYSATVTPAPLIAAGLRVTINFSGFKAGLNNYLSVNSSTAFPIYQNGIDLFVAEETISYGECLDLVLVADDTSVDNYHWEIINAGEILNMNLQISVDTALSSTSTNPVQNKIVNTAINTINNKLGTTTMGTTATTITGAIAELKNAQTTGGVTVDEALSSTSTNPVQNKTVYTALNSGYYGVATMSVGTDTVTYSATVTPAPLIAAGLRVTINFSGFKAGLNNYLSVNSSTAFPIYQNGIDLFVAEETISYGECLDLVLVADDTSVDNYHWEIINAGEILNMNLQISVDTALSSTSTNPVQNKIVNTAINTINNKLGTTTMGTTATTITGAIAELKNAQSSGTGADSSFDGSADFDIIPADSETYDLGNATNAWNCVYANIVDASQVSVEEVATNTIELGSVVLNITDFNQGRITYVICDTEQDNTAKIGTPTSYTDFSMTNEMHFAVQFTNGLAENTSATLNINNTAAYPITIDGTNYYTGSVPAGGVLEVVYYDNSFIVVNPNNDTLGNSAESAKLNAASSGKNAVKVSSQSALTSAISNSSNDGCVIEFSGTSSTTQYILYLDKISSSITNLTIRGASSSRASNYLKIALYNSTAPTYNAKFKLTIERTNVEIAQPNIYKTAIPTLVFNNCNVTATLNNLSTFTAGKLIQATELVLNNCTTTSKITETSAKIDTIFDVFWAEKIKVIGGYLNTAGRPYDSDICVNLLGSSGKTAGESCISDGCQISQYDLTTSSTYSNAGKHCVISAYAFDVSGCTIKNSCTTTYATNYCLFCTDIAGTAVTAGTVFENNTVSGYSSMFIHCETIKGNTFTTSGTLMLSLDDGSIISDNTFTNTAVTLQGATSGERVQYWDNIASSITLGSNISRTLVNRKVERIGTWIDGTPIWRVMFRYALEDTDREDFTNNSTMSLTSYCKTVSSSSDYCIYLRWGATLISGETPCLIDDMNLVPTSNIECDVDTSQVSEAYIKSASPTYLYGWIEFATPESKLAS